MNLEEKIKYIETKKGINHDLMEFRSWLNEAMPEHKQLKKIQVGGRGLYFAAFSYTL